MLYDSAADVSYSRDVFGRELSAVNAIAAYSYSPDDNGLATNETVTITDVAHGLSRIADNDGRLIAFDAGEGYAAQTITYRPDGKIAAISTADAVVSYTYGEGGLETGYSLSVVGGATFTRTVLRDPFRRGMILDVQNSIGQGYGYTYDALSRPVTRNADTFAYNFRSEVIGANVAGQSESYDYDNIGNSTFAAVNSVTNIYAANGLNQYVSVASDEGVVEPAYDEDGNMVAYGPWSYAYDSVGRLTTASSNGLIVATNYYDHQGRRVRLVTQTAAHTFIYDGWNVVLELVEHDGVTDRIEYYWGRDLSGTLQGAGGVGGLLYLKINGTVYVPIYDANGNVMEYRTADGSLAAAYVYDSFGRTFSQTGSLADVFRFGYSTKSFERETGLYYYGKRFYLVRLRRWLNRDPIGRFSTSPRSPLLRCVFLMLIALSVVFETVVGIEIFTAGVKCADALLLGCLSLLCVLDLCFIVNRCVDRAGLRFLWCAFSRERLAVVETEVGGKQIVTKHQKVLLSFAILLCFVYACVIWAVLQNRARA